MRFSRHLQSPSDLLSHRAALSDFVSDAAFPCVGAKSALNKGRMRFAEYESLGRGSDAADLCDQLQNFSSEFPDPGASPVSFVAMFRDQVSDERKFETALWRHLQLMHEHDRVEFTWDRSVDSDPASNDFSFSIGGRSFFVVGLHPTATRLSRRTPFPCLVFNFHDQFEQLKSSGKYQSMQTVIRERDVELQGSVNPVLERFGAASEARQYSGRAVDADWRCPFAARGAIDA
jgi:uncharacterized protein